MPIINKAELARCFELILEQLNEETHLDMDYYLTIDTSEMVQIEESPEVVIGSLEDDWAELQRRLREGDYFSAVDYDRVAAVLRAISEWRVS